MGDRLFPSVDAHVIDTNPFIVFERNQQIDRLERDSTGIPLESSLSSLS
ncbi:hypothetical protein [Natronolimnohabitans innermongolicus]|nr:hypothetical protein [Natronolimnohabitans innermongolicus]